jgi:uncharacterized membrane protein
LAGVADSVAWGFTRAGYKDYYPAVMACWLFQLT